MEGEQVVRTEPCRSCGETKGIKISNVDYWDLKHTAIAKCITCGTAQLDPMLSEHETAKGCLAYYIEESLRSSVDEQKKNALRNFRRGVHFAYSIRKMKRNPIEILELGPGSGYFLQGIQFVFPQVKITVLDVNREVLDFNSAQHGYATIQATPEHTLDELKNRFDLIIARDIIEHVTDIGSVIKNVYAWLKPGGLFHFITPNGHEDAWRFYIRYKAKKETSELLINHVNYFDGNGLAEHLFREKFTEVDYYTYKLKTAFRGRGRKMKTKLMAPVSQKRNADFYITKKIGEVREIQLNKQDILNKWYLKPGRQNAARFICWYKHAEWIKVDPRINVGHEIYGVFEKK